MLQRTPSGFIEPCLPVAKKAAVAAGLAAVGTALSELAPEQKGSESEAPNETETKHERSRR
jgi:hypothetical protein